MELCAFVDKVILATSFQNQLTNSVSLRIVRTENVVSEKALGDVIAGLVLSSCGYRSFNNVSRI